MLGEVAGHSVGPVFDAELLASLRSAGGASVVSDAADSFGLGDCAVGLGLRPIGLTGPIVGRARPVRLVPVDERPEDPFAAEIEYVDSLIDDDVVVVAGETERAACWGELLSTAAKARGAAGAVIVAPVRDVELIERTGFPVLATGTHPGDLQGRAAFVGADEPAVLAGLIVRRGDLVVADRDGVTAIPADAAAAVAEDALAKAATETEMRALLRGGATLREAFDRFRVL